MERKQISPVTSREAFNDNAAMQADQVLMLRVHELSEADQIGFEALQRHLQDDRDMHAARQEKIRPQLIDEKKQEILDQHRAERRHRLVPKWLPTTRREIERAAERDAEAHVDTLQARQNQLLDARQFGRKLDYVINAEQRQMQQSIRDETPERGMLKQQFNGQGGMER